jgi:hypothetical protein
MVISPARRGIRFGAIGLLMMVICTSCRVDVDISVTVDKNGAGTIEIAAEADQQVIQQAPNLAADLQFADAIAAGWVVQQPTPTATGGLQVSLSHTFETVDQANGLLASLNGPDGPLNNFNLSRTKTKSLTRLRLEGALLLDGDVASFTDADLLGVVGGTPYAQEIANRGLQPADTMSVTFRAKLAGAVKSTTGELIDDQLTWTVPLTGTPTKLTTVTEATQSSNSWASPLAKGAYFALLAWSAFAVLFILYVILARRRRILERGGRLN